LGDVSLCPRDRSRFLSGNIKHLSRDVDPGNLEPTPMELLGVVPGATRNINHLGASRRVEKMAQSVDDL
jgi:hypothetical protein